MTGMLGTKCGGGWKPGDLTGEARARPKAITNPGEPTLSYCCASDANQSTLTDAWKTKTDSEKTHVAASNAAYEKEGEENRAAMVNEFAEDSWRLE